MPHIHIIINKRKYNNINIYNKKEKEEIENKSIMSGENDTSLAKADRHKK